MIQTNSDAMHALIVLVYISMGACIGVGVIAVMQMTRTIDRALP